MGRFSRYYPFIIVTSTMLQILMVACMHQVRMGQYLCLAALQLAQLTFMIITKPFKQRTDNLRAILIPLLTLIMYTIDIILIGTKTYIFELEVVAIIVVLTILISNFILLCIQIINSYSQEIYECFKPCIMKFRISRKNKYEKMQHRESLVVEEP